MTHSNTAVEHHEAHPTATEEAASKGEKMAVLIFPVVIVFAAVIAFIAPEPFVGVGPYVTYLLMFIMFTMGLTLTIPDLALVAKRPLPILIGVVCQFIVMPLSAVLVSKMLGLSDAVTIGLILLGSVPGGTASNVVAYLAKGDVALSVAMTSVSTLVSPIMTPMLMLWLAGEATEVDGAGMMWTLVQTVLIPVGLGLTLRFFVNSLVDKVIPALPWLSIAAIGTVVMAVVARSQETLVIVGFIVFVGVAIQNFIGFAAGYFTAKATKQREAACRTTAIEVATQNSALASALALQFFTPEAALPGVVAAVWANVTGALYAAFVRSKPIPKD